MPTFNDGVNGTGLLTETAIYAFGHVDILKPSGSYPERPKTLSRTILGSLSGPVKSGFTLNGDSLRRTDGFAQFAS